MPTRKFLHITWEGKSRCRNAHLGETRLKRSERGEEARVGIHRAPTQREWQARHPADGATDTVPLRWSGPRRHVAERSTGLAQARSPPGGAAVTLLAQREKHKLEAALPSEKTPQKYHQRGGAGEVHSLETWPRAGASPAVSGARTVGEIHAPPATVRLRRGPSPVRSPPRKGDQGECLSPLPKRPLKSLHLHGKRLFWFRCYCYAGICETGLRARPV